MNSSNYKEVATVFIKTFVKEMVKGTAVMIGTVGVTLAGIGLIGYIAERKEK